MAGYKEFVDDVPLFASELNGYLMEQTVMRFPSTVLLVNTLAGVAEPGQLAWADSTEVLYLWNGTNWLPWQSPEKSFSPVFTAGGTNITFGNSTTSSWWRYSGGLVQWDWRMIVGSTANLGAGNYAWSMPIATRAELTQHYIGHGTYLDASSGTTFHRALGTLGTTSSFGAVAEAGQRMGSAAPVAFAVNDVFGFSLRYLPSTGTYL